MVVNKIGEILADPNPYNREWKIKGELKPYGQAGQGWWHLFTDSSGTIYLYLDKQVTGKFLVKGQLAYQQTGPYFYATEAKEPPKEGTSSSVVLGLGVIGVLICATLAVNEVTPGGISFGQIISMFRTSSSLSVDEKNSQLAFVLEGTYRKENQICADITNNAEITVARGDLDATKVYINDLPIEIETDLLPSSVSAYETFTVCACTKTSTNGCGPQAATYNYQPDGSGKYPPIRIQINLPYGTLSMRG